MSRSFIKEYRAGRRNIKVYDLKLIKEILDVPYECFFESYINNETFEHFLNTADLMKSSKPLSFSAFNNLKRVDSGVRRYYCRHVVCKSIILK